MEREATYAEAVSSAQVGEYWLTHVLWHNGYGACPETGVRRGEVFTLIQHGWRDFDAAQKVIAAGLAKGWDTKRIWRVMDFIRDRRTRPVLI